MANIALGKSILETEWKRSELVTNNNFTNYDGSNGFAHAPWPKNLTLDLEGIFEISTIRFLLWDRDLRAYKYRLLTSEDYKTWRVHYDTFDNGYKGWQEFNFSEKIKARYIRIHCLWNSMNIEFHIIELQVYDGVADSLDKPVINKRVISIKNQDDLSEIGTGLPLTQEMRNLTDRLEKVINEYPMLNPQPINEIIKHFRIQTYDIEALEMSIDAIRREIIGPVKRELEESKKLGKFSVWGFYVGALGFFVTAISLLYTSFEKKNEIKNNYSSAIVRSDSLAMKNINEAIKEWNYYRLGFNDQYKPSNNELKVSQFETVKILTQNDHNYSIQAYIPKEIEEMGEWYPIVQLKFFKDGSQLGNKGLKAAVPIINKSKLAIYDTNLNSIRLSEEDGFILFDKYKYVVMRIFRKESNILTIGDKEEGVLIRRIE